MLKTIGNRTISIIPDLIKIFESIVHSHIKISLNRIIIDEPHGFRPGNLTITCSVVYCLFLFKS